MESRFLTVLLLLSSALATPVLARPPTSESINWGTSSRAIIIHPDANGDPLMLMIEAFNIKYCSYTEPHDLLCIWLFVGVSPENPTGFVPLVMVTDDPVCAGRINAMFGEGTSVLVDDSDLEVWSRLKVELNVELPLNGMTVHPFEMRLKSEGPGSWTEEIVELPTGYTITLRMKASEATGTVTTSDGELPTVQAWIFHPMEMTITGFE